MITPSSPAGLDPQDSSTPDHPAAQQPAIVSQPERSIRIGEQEWVARVEGTSAAGNGSYNLALLAALRFSRASEPDRPILEVLLPAGRFPVLFDEELVELFGRARPMARETG
jgi:hypothetical protein